MKLHSISFQKLSVLFGMLLLIAFVVSSCEKEDLTIADDNIIAQDDEQGLALLKRAPAPGTYVAEGIKIPTEAELAEVIGDEKAPNCGWRICTKVGTNAVLFIEGLDPLGNPFVLSFAGPFSQCIDLTGLFLPQKVKISYAGTGAAKTQITGYVLPGAPVFPPQVSLNFPATPSVVFVQEEVKLNSNCTATN